MQTIKSKRQEAIRSAIESAKITSQEDLKDTLTKNGITVSQATLSRDLQELGAIKDRSGNGSYYTLPSRSHEYKDLDASVLSIESSGNLLVIHSIPGHASMLASTIDRNNSVQFAGTIAGDDTIFVAIKDGIDKDSAMRALCSVLNK